MLYAVFFVFGAFIGQYAFGEDIWYVDPEKVVNGLKVCFPLHSSVHVERHERSGGGD